MRIMRPSEVLKSLPTDIDNQLRAGVPYKEIAVGIKKRVDRLFEPPSYCRVDWEEREPSERSWERMNEDDSLVSVCGSAGCINQGFVQKEGSGVLCKECYEKIEEE